MQLSPHALPVVQYLQQAGDVAGFGVGFGSGCGAGGAAGSETCTITGIEAETEAACAVSDRDAGAVREASDSATGARSFERASTTGTSAGSIGTTGGGSSQLPNALNPPNAATSTAEPI